MIGVSATRRVVLRLNSHRLSLLFLTATAAAGLSAGAATSQAAHVAAASTSICSHVSPGSVSAIIGYSVPAATQTTTREKATPANYNISSVDTTCAYGAETSLADLKKTVLLESDIASKSLTAAQIQASFKKAEKAAHAIQFKITTYSGLGVSGYYVTESVSGISAQIIAGVSGTHNFSAAVYSKTVSKSKLAALAELAEKL